MELGLSRSLPGSLPPGSFFVKTLAWSRAFKYNYLVNYGFTGADQ
jgi:hypothetical protein